MRAEGESAAEESTGQSIDGARSVRWGLRPGRAARGSAGADTTTVFPAGR